ncbi:unnamed protein product [Allacma fusca]|uniref:Uncharacterized protein n=1 Tax=Allacma fusca TaxID=39272 RepID=A0A8J2PK09_9HEXA|nr:unnamed protein product [Allacma fusca]
MPHVSAGSSGSTGSSTDRIRSDDPNDCDEVKVFKCAEDEGECDKLSDDVIDDDKRELIRDTECDQGRKSPSYPRSGHSSSYSSKNGQCLRPDPASIFILKSKLGLNVQCPSVNSPWSRKLPIDEIGQN